MWTVSFINSAAIYEWTVMHDAHDAHVSDNCIMT